MPRTDEARAEARAPAGLRPLDVGVELDGGVHAEEVVVVEAVDGHAAGEGLLVLLEPRALDVDAEVADPRHEEPVRDVEVEAGRLEATGVDVEVGDAGDLL